LGDGKKKREEVLVKKGGKKRGCTDFLLWAKGFRRKKNGTMIRQKKHHQDRRGRKGNSCSRQKLEWGKRSSLSKGEKREGA